MRKSLSEEAKKLEAAHWTALKKVLDEKTVKVCRK